MEKTKKKFQINNVSLLITVVLFILMFAFGSVKYDNFFSISYLYLPFVCCIFPLYATIKSTILS